MISEELQCAAIDSSSRLERVGGLPVWETHPVMKRQSAALRIQNSFHPINEIEGRRAAVFYPDIEILFPEGSVKRPEISRFCQEPDDQESAATLIPEAIIEILSRGYQAKDLVIGVPFYLARGTRDVIVFDPVTSRTKHFRKGETRDFASAVETRMECGFVCTV